jgi:hypothetical protein
VALPHDRCVHVEVSQREAPVALRIGAALLGEAGLGTPGVTVFGQRSHDHQVTSSEPDSRHPGPTLRVEFSSSGGELVVRDYPDDVDPRGNPDWPGYPVFVEERPDTTGTPRRAAERLVRQWRERRKSQLRSQRRIDRLLPGPCAVEETRR